MQFYVLIVSCIFSTSPSFRFGSIRLERVCFLMHCSKKSKTKKEIRNNGLIWLERKKNLVRAVLWRNTKQNILLNCNSFEFECTRWDIDFGTCFPTLDELSFSFCLSTCNFVAFCFCFSYVFFFSAKSLFNENSHSKDSIFFPHYDQNYVRNNRLFSPIVVVVICAPNSRSDMTKHLIVVHFMRFFVLCGFF